MQHNERVELLRLLPERLEGRVGQLASRDVGENLRALEAELADAALELLGRLIAVWHRHAAQSGETVWHFGDKLCDAVIDDARRLDRDPDRHRVVALRR